MTDSLYHAAAMLWKMLWALVLGFSISATLQVFVSKEKMAGIFGKNGLREVAMALDNGPPRDPSGNPPNATPSKINPPALTVTMQKQGLRIPRIERIEKVAGA